MGRWLAGLIAACHPGPTAAVTTFTLAYAAVLGAGPARLLAIALAVVAGQLCVGWSNDAVDARIDRLAGREDKPLARGQGDVRAVTVAAVLAGVAAVPLSLRLGVAAGVLHLVAVGAALAYNLGLKSTALSALPYAFSFALLPVVTTLAVDADERPPVLHVVAAALLGAAAHFGNTVGDARADAATGVRGLPQRLGPRASLVVMAVVVAMAAGVLLVGVVLAADVGAGRRALAVVALVAGVGLAGVVAVGRVGVGGGRLAWRLTLVSVGLVVLGFLAAA